MFTHVLINFLHIFINECTPNKRHNSFGDYFNKLSKLKTVSLAAKIFVPTQITSYDIINGLKDLKRNNLNILTPSFCLCLHYKKL